MTAPMLESYVAGRWFAAPDDGAPVADAVTGETVARVSSTGLDVPAMLDHARSVGGPALRELTFHQRAGLLKALALRLMADKDEFYAISHRTGATDRDNAVDIDGGFGTVLSYASKAKRELPDDTIVLDGPVEALGKRGTFAGQHLYTPLRGVAVQINAFNFPVWGFLEKLAPAFLAGVPSIVKPASQTAYLTEAVVRRIVESGLLPEGSLQLLAGSAAGVLDLLTGQDLVFFTGSAATARKLRRTPAVVANSVRFNAEAD
ncbi:MAG: aldehyde dehydrogenase family protein, partial [Blastococcus sp.]